MDGGGSPDTSNETVISGPVVKTQTPLTTVSGVTVDSGQTAITLSRRPPFVVEVYTTRRRAGTRSCRTSPGRRAHTEGHTVHPERKLTGFRRLNTFL